MVQKGVGRGQFNKPSGIAVTPKGTILVGDSNNHRIQELTMKGECIACVGSKGNGPLQFKYPRGIAINKTTGHIFVADESNDRIQVLNPDLTFSYTIGSGGSGQGQFDRPRDVAFDSKGFVYVADTSNHRIQKFTLPSGITVDDNHLLYITESGANNRVSIFTTHGEFIHCFGKCGDKEGQFNNPRELSCDKNGCLYVCDLSNCRVVVY